jgi:hypothetical protein
VGEEAEVYGAIITATVVSVSATQVPQWFHMTAIAIAIAAVVTLIYFTRTTILPPLIIPLMVCIL